ncbi:hypothetical protein N8248_07660 [Rhodospirillaceae bacterium]|nr:hypothetical protein [Alphaproteobacteria bacterium]MDC1442560.1 hypothetical protein [Rhodospirillaceae bacterium]
MNTLKKTEELTFITLGPSGTNHEFVTHNYLKYRGIQTASVHLIDNFQLGLSMIADGEADHMVQVAVHPDCADVVAKAHFEYDIHIVDTFISPSKELGILTRRDVKVPKSIALQPATRKYADLNKWKEFVPVNSIMHVAEGLLEGRYDSGLTTVEIAEQYKDVLRIDTRIGTVDDSWIVYGRCRVSNGEIIASPTCSAFANFSMFDGQ